MKRVGEVRKEMTDGPVEPEQVELLTGAKKVPKFSVGSSTNTVVDSKKVVTI